MKTTKNSDYRDWTIGIDFVNNERKVKSFFEYKFYF